MSLPVSNIGISKFKLAGFVISLLLITVVISYGQQNDYKVIDTIKVESSFELISAKDYEDAYGYIINEKTFKPVSIQVHDSIHNFVAVVQTKTKKWYNLDGQQKDFTVDIFPLFVKKLKTYHFQQACDEIYFNSNGYSTQKYGCCGEPDVVAFYDYNNQLMLKGNYFLVRNYSYQHEFLASFDQNKKDSSNALGKFYFLNSNNELFELNVVAKKLKNVYYNDGLTLHVKESTGKNISLENIYQNCRMIHVDAENYYFEIIVAGNPKLPLSPDQYREMQGKQFDKKIIIPVIQGRPFGRRDKQYEFFID